MRSSIVFIFWALIQQANGEACESGHWAVHMQRSEANELDCSKGDTEVWIEAQIQACVKLGSGGKLHRSGHRYHSDRITRRLLTNPEPRKLRTVPLQQRTTPFQRTTPLKQEERDLEQERCTTCEDCGSWICQYTSQGGEGGYCVDTCGEGMDCTCSRRLEADDNQDQERNLDWDKNLKRESPAWYDRRITRRCGFLLKAFAEDLMQDKGNYCLGDPDKLKVEAVCMEF